jgi:hypothetical protein
MAIAIGNGALCAGWASTPAARMACCAGITQCPMHASDGHSSASPRTVTQDQADSCCAASERQQPQKPSGIASPIAISAAVLGVALVVPPVPPPLVLSDGWRTILPAFTPPAPRHLLLSVFLV